jgi:hypothetical protein
MPKVSYWFILSPIGLPLIVFGGTTNWWKGCEKRHCRNCRNCNDRKPTPFPNHVGQTQLRAYNRTQSFDTRRVWSGRYTRLRVCGCFGKKRGINVEKAFFNVARTIRRHHMQLPRKPRTSDEKNSNEQDRSEIVKRRVQEKVQERPPKPRTGAGCGSLAQHHYACSKRRVISSLAGFTEAHS